MPERQHDDGIVRGIKTIRRDIAGIAERNHQLAQLRRIATALKSSLYSSSNGQLTKTRRSDVAIYSGLVPTSAK